MKDRREGEGKKKEGREDKRREEKKEGREKRRETLGRLGQEVGWRREKK